MPLESVVVPKDIMALWENTVCELRAEIKSWDLIGPHVKDYAYSLCNKLENSMVNLCKNEKVDKVTYTIE